jgi:aldehyde oxidoreductase
VFIKIKEGKLKSLTLKINGIQRRLAVEEDMVLLDLLREELKLTGTKQGCDRKGQCGACTVIVNDKTVLSCLTKVANLDGAEVITVEGLGTPDKPHLIQEAAGQESEAYPRGNQDSLAQPPLPLHRLR